MTLAQEMTLLGQKAKEAARLLAKAAPRPRTPPSPVWPPCSKSGKPSCAPPTRRIWTRPAPGAWTPPAWTA